MTQEEVENLWNDSRNWKWGGIYYCKVDPRVVVPKRRKWMGWTVNFARPSAIPILLLLITLVAVPLLVVRANGAGTGIELMTGVWSITVLCLVCAYLSSRTK